MKGIGLTERFKASFKRKRTRDAIFYTLVLAYPVAQFCVFYLGVNFNSILLAFKRYNEQGKYVWAGTENFKTLFANFRDLTAFRVAFVNSLKVYISGAVVHTTLSLLFAYYIHKKQPFGNVFKILLFMPSVIPSIALIVMFKQIADNGVPTFMKLLGLNVGGLLSTPSTTLSTIIFYNICFGFGVSMLLYIGAMGRIQDSVTEAAQIDGAGYWREFWHITLPLTFDTIATFMVVSIGAIFSSQANVFAFFSSTAEEYVYTIGYWLYRETIKVGAYADYPMLSAFGLLLSFATTPLVYFARWLFMRFGPTTEQRRVKNDG